MGSNSIDIDLQQLDINQCHNNRTSFNIFAVDIMFVQGTPVVITLIFEVWTSSSVIVIGHCSIFLAVNFIFITGVRVALTLICAESNFNPEIKNQD